MGEKQFRRLLEVRRCDVSGQNPVCPAERLARTHRSEALLDEMVEQTGQFHIKDLDINGSDLIQIDYTPGSSIGSTLSELADQVVEGAMENKRDILLREVGQWLVREQAGPSHSGDFFSTHYLKYIWIVSFGMEYNREPLPWAVGK